MKRPTQSDVARVAGVSRATVSYIVNNRTADSGISITAKTRQRVLDAISELGYVPNERARSLRSGDTKTLGLLIPDTLNPHYWAIAHGVQEEAHTAGYGLGLYGTKLDPDREAKTLTDLLRMRVDGLILVPSFFKQSKAILDRLADRQQPVVVLGQTSFEFDTVTPETEQGMHDLIIHLKELGHRRLGFVHGVSSPDLGTVRLSTFATVLEQNNLPHDEKMVVHCGSSIEDGHTATRRLLSMSSPPTAIIMINDLLAIGALRAAADLGCSVPHDVSIAGFDNTFMAAYTIPTLTTVETNAVEMGRTSVRLALTRLREPTVPGRHIRVPSELVIRASTDRCSASHSDCQQCRLSTATGGDSHEQVRFTHDQ